MAGREKSGGKSGLHQARSAWTNIPETQRENILRIYAKAMRSSPPPVAVVMWLAMKSIVKSRSAQLIAEMERKKKLRGPDK